MSTKADRRPRTVGRRSLRARIEELEETLRAIRSGEVDALVVETAGEDRVYTLTSADQTYRLMVEQMPTGAATLSHDGVVLYCNPCLAALLKVPADAVLGERLSRFLDAPATASLRSLLQAVEGGISRGEISFRSGEGSVPTEVSLTRLSLGGTLVYCVIVTDLTDRRRREEERAQLASEQVARAEAEEAHRQAREEIELRKRVEESLRQAELQRTELLQRERVARLEAEEANRLKDEFLATLSHELRSPLNAVLAWSYLLCDPGLDHATVSRSAEAIDRNARTLAQLVANILDVSQIITGKFQMSLGPVRLSEVIESAADTVRLAAQAKSIHLDLAIDSAIAPVLGDASRLQQVIWNLLSNAIRFTPVGGRVQLRLQDSGPCSELSVTDDGPGIDPGFLPYVFDRFRQGDSSSTRGHGGVGLGLAIVRHLVELHGGTVAARNRDDGSGARFVIRLPRQGGLSGDAALAGESAALAVATSTAPAGPGVPP